MGQAFGPDGSHSPQYTPEALAALRSQGLFESGEAVRIVVMSDTHNMVSTATDASRVPPGDVFIHCGDVTVDGTAREACTFNNWLGLLPHKHRIVIAGNHDLVFDPETYHANVAMSSKDRKAKHAASGAVEGWNLPEYMPSEDVDPDGRKQALSTWRCQVRQRLLSNATLYLEGEAAELAIQIERGANVGRTVHLHIAGAPHTDVIAMSSMRAFAVDEERQLAVFSRCLEVPLDILITHGPPYGILDKFVGTHTGSKALARALARCSPPSGRAPSFHVFGHVHKQKGMQVGATLPLSDARGADRMELSTTFVNAASVTGMKHRIRDDPAVIMDVPVTSLVAHLPK